MNKDAQTVEELNEENVEVNESTCCQEDCESTEEVETISETESLKQQIEELKDQLLRNAAELENFKRRMNEERARETKYRAQSIVTNIIPAIDNFERALSSTIEDEQTKTFLTGFKMIHAQLVEALEKEGVESIEAEGVAFDPMVHQAVMQEAVEGVESGMVIQELQKGYKLKDRVIRPAMVKVSE
ncbi:MAG: nucleotide exchange factor GrpE [Turicibacter sp.]|nr:nucleotide exchange factor GrpE [Turicibacter sp.]